MKLLFTDVETTGLDPNVDRITELGAVIWDTETKKVLEIYNELVYGEEPEVSEFITELTGIDQEMIDRHGVFGDRVAARFHEMANKCEAIVAHNAPFDKSFIDVFLQSYHCMIEAHWIDTSVDIDFPPKIKTRALNHLLADHGINPNAFAHRAIFDVLKTIELFEKYDCNDIMLRSKMDNVEVAAVCQVPWEDTKEVKDTEVAKQNGFRFNPDTKQWIRNMKTGDIERVAKDTGLKLEVLQ